MPALNLRQKEILFAITAIAAFASFSFDFLWAGLGLLLLAGIFLVLLRKADKETEQETTKTNYAGFGYRFGSQMADFGFYYLPVLALLILIGTVFFNPVAEYGYGICLTLVEFYMLKRWGQSLGKMSLGVKILRKDLAPIGWTEILIRNWYDILFLTYYFSKYLLFALGIGVAITGFSGSNGFLGHFDKALLRFNWIWLLSELIVLLTNKRKRAIHDYLAGTVVVVEEKKNPLSRNSRVILVGSVAVTLFYFCYSFTHRYYRDSELARLGDKSGQFLLGKDYFQGSGIPQDYALAYQWFQKSAGQGDEMAELYLGKMYENGYYVKADKAEAIQWYSLAFKNGWSLARMDLKRLGVNPETIK